MNTLLDNLFARRPKLHYVCPPICGLLPAITSSGTSAISFDPGLIPPSVLPADCVTQRFTEDGYLTWDAYPGAICYNVYAVVEVSAPLIVTNPEDQSVPWATNVSFSVVASGTPTIGYQWYFNGVLIPGVISNTLTLPNVTDANEGSYYVIATNVYGTVTSLAATLDVGLQPPFITVQPVSQTVFSGDVTFTVVAGGGAPLSYQWQKNGVDIGGATSTSYTIVGVTNADVGDYTVVVSNPVASVTSDIATLALAGPAALPGLFAWWKADAMAFSNGTQVGNPGTTEWPDSSGNGHKLSNSDTDTQPTFLTGILNGKPVVRFSAGNHHHLHWAIPFSATPGVGTGAFTVIFVGNATDPTSTVLGSSAINQRFHRRFGSNAATILLNSTMYTSSLFSGGASDYGATTWRRPDGAAPNGSFRQNTTAQGTFPTVGGDVVNLDTLGGSAVGSFWLGGDIAEICIYQGELSDAQVDALYTSYFQSKWGLP